jgi:hypothetical protein
MRFNPSAEMRDQDRNKLKERPNKNRAVKRALVDQFCFVHALFASSRHLSVISRVCLTNAQQEYIFGFASRRTDHDWNLTLGGLPVRPDFSKGQRRFTDQNPSSYPP